MDVYAESVHRLSVAEKLQLVERIWDELANEPLPIPEWAVCEAARRRDEMIADVRLGETHDDTWMRIRAACNAT